MDPEKQPGVEELAEKAGRIDAGLTGEPPEEAPPPEISPAPAAQAEADAGRALAMFGVEACADLATRKWPVLSFDDAVKTKAVDVTVPLLVKYHITPEWLARWKEEIAAGVFFATLITECVKKVRADAAEKKKAEPAPDSAGPVAVDPRFVMKDARAL